MLMKMQKLFKKNKKGFTLVELMAVVLIIGLLTAIAIPMFMNAGTRAAQRTHDANLRIIDGAINTYHAEYGVWPTTSGPIVADHVLKDHISDLGDLKVPETLEASDLSGSGVDGSIEPGDSYELDDTGGRPRVLPEGTYN